MNTVTVTETKNEVTVNETTNTVTVQEGVATVVTVKTEGPQGQALSDGDKGDVTVASNGTSVTVNAGVIDNANIASNAAIAGTKISPDFGSQNIATLGNIVCGDGTQGRLTIKGNQSFLLFTDNNDNDDFEIRVDGGIFRIQDQQNDLVSLQVNTDGHVDIPVNLDVGAGLDVTGLITANDIKIGDNSPVLNFTDNNADADNKTWDFKCTDNNVFTIQAINDSGGGGGGLFKFTRTGNNIDTFEGTKSAITWFTVDNVNRKVTTRDLDVTNNITVTGTVDSVDIATRDTLFGALTSSSGVLTDGVTATTQSASDNSTKVATTAYTDTAIANLIDSSPSALNTLNELASALGDDPNFATTVTNSIATKLPLAGGTLTGNLEISNNNPKITLTDTNNDSDFAIILNQGIFKIRDLTNSSTDRFTIDSSGTINVSGNLDIGAGCDVTGNITVSGTVDGRDLAADGSKLDTYEANGGSYLRSDADDSFSGTITGNSDTANPVIQIQGSGPNFIRFATDASGTVDADSIDVIYRTTPNTLGFERSSDASKIFFVDADDLQTTFEGNVLANAGLDVTGTINGGELHLSADTPRIKLTDTNADDDFQISNFSGNFIIKDMTDLVERFRIESDGTSRFTSNLQVAEDNAKLQIGASQDLEIYHDSANTIIENKTGNFQFITTSTGQLRVRGHAYIFNSHDDQEGVIKAYENAQVELYHDGVKRIETSSNGVEVFNRLRCLGGAAPSMQLNSDVTGSNTNTRVMLGLATGANQFISGATTNDFVLNVPQKFLIGHDSNEYMAKFDPDGAASLFFDNSEKFTTTATGATVTTASSANSIRNITTSTSQPSGGTDGDLWFTYTA